MQDGREAELVDVPPRPWIGRSYHLQPVRFERRPAPFDVGRAQERRGWRCSLWSVAPFCVPRRQWSRQGRLDGALEELKIVTSRQMERQPFGGSTRSKPGSRRVDVLNEHVVLGV